MEVDLIRALIRWGKYQMQQDLDKGGNMRSKMLPGLKQIRFDSFTHTEFAKILCQEGLEDVLTDGEQSSIFKSIISKDIWKPTEVSPSKLAPRYAPYTVCDVHFKRNHGNYYMNNDVNRSLVFKVNKSVELAGIKVNRQANANNISFGLYCASNIKIAEGSSKVKSKNREDEFLTITPMCKLVGGVTYTMKFTLPDGKYLETYSCFLDYQSQSVGLTLNIQTNYLCAELLAIVFKR
jgi:hypothetical protein